MIRMVSPPSVLDSRSCSMASMVTDDLVDLGLELRQRPLDLDERSLAAR